MSYAATFEDLTIWVSARAGFKETYVLLAESREHGLWDQMNRATLSVMNNIAEGFERGSKKEFARYLDIAKASAGEVRSMFYAFEDIGWISPEQAAQQRQFYRQLSASIAAFRRHLVT